MLHLCTVTLVGTEVSVIDESIMYVAEIYFSEASENARLSMRRKRSAYDSDSKPK